MKKIDIKTILFLTFLIISNISVFGEIIQTIGATSDGNITSSIKPQGTSIGQVQNESSDLSDKPNTDVVNNITSSIKPQGTSIGQVQNESSDLPDKPNTDVVNNITSSIKPQGTSMDNIN